MSNFKKNHWRVAIHFLKKEGLKPSEAAKKLQLHYGDSAPDGNRTKDLTRTEDLTPNEFCLVFSPFGGLKT